VGKNHQINHLNEHLRFLICSLFSLKRLIYHTELPVLKIPTMSSVANIDHTELDDMNWLRENSKLYKENS